MNEEIKLISPKSTMYKRVLFWIVFLSLAGVSVFVFQKYINESDNSIDGGKVFVDDREMIVYACFGAEIKEISCDLCVRKDGKIVEHGAAPTCELKAKDQGKRCVYNHECDKQVCVYENVSATFGTCDDYMTDNDQVEEVCQRFQGKPVQCISIMS